MKKSEQIYREILYQTIEQKNRTFTQKELSTRLNISLGNVNHALLPLRKMGAIKVNPRNFVVFNPKKILYYWACLRNVDKDIIYKTRIDASVRDIEQKMPRGVLYTAYSGYKFLYHDVPADYSEVYVYSDSLDVIKKRFPIVEKIPNLFVLQMDENMHYPSILAGQVFVDLWNLKEWYAKDFLKAFEVRLHGILE